MTFLKNLFYNLFLFSISLLSLNCKSTSSLQNTAQDQSDLKNRIELHVKSLNESDEKLLKSIYAADYEGLSPVTKFDSKQDLIAKLVENQRKLNIRIDMEIIEISTTAHMAFTVLKWKAFTNADSPQEQFLYEKVHLQIWEKNKGQWQLKRSLFYN